MAWASPQNDDNGGKYYALIIAIDEYKGSEWAQLKTPINDANVISDILANKYGFEEVIKLYDDEATRANIIDYIDRLSQVVTSKDNILIYFSGHGIEIGNEGYWVPSDATGKERSQLIPNSEIKNALAKTTSKHALVMVDACFSGTIFKSSQLFVENDGSENYYARVDGLVSRQAITAGGLEPVLDGQGDHSTFAKYVIKFLKKNKKNALDAGELYEMVKFPVQANSPNVPRFGHIQNTGHEGGQFIFRINQQKVGSCNFSGVKIKEGAKVIFPVDGGTLHAIVNEYDKKIYYQWLKGSSTLSSASPDLKITESGTYSVIVTTDDECQDAAVVEVVIALPDTEVFIEEGSDVAFTNGGVLTAKLSKPMDGVVYEWSKNNYIIGQEATLPVNEEGTYEVIIRLKDGRRIASAIANVSIKERTYKVRIGDNMERIARKFYDDAGRADYLYAINSDLVEKGALLQVGTEIRVPLMAEEASDFTPKSVASRIYIAANEDMPPFSQIGLYNNGMLTDIVKTTLKETGEIPVISYVSGNVMRAQTFSGKSAAAYPCVYNSDDARLFYYSEPLYKELTVLFVSKTPPLDANGEPKKLDYRKDRDLRGKKIAIVRGFISDKMLKMLKDRQIGLVAKTSWEECFELLKKGDVDYVAAPQMVGIMALKSAKNVDINDFKMLSKAFETIDFHLVVSKQNPNGETFMKGFNAAFKKLKADGKISQIQNAHVDIFQNEN